MPLDLFISFLTFLLIPIFWSVESAVLSSSLALLFLFSSFLSYVDRNLNSLISRQMLFLMFVAPAAFLIAGKFPEIGWRATTDNSSFLFLRITPLWILLAGTGFTILYFRLKLSKSNRRKDRYYYYLVASVALFVLMDLLFSQRFEGFFSPKLSTVTALAVLGPVGGYFLSHLLGKKAIWFQRFQPFVAWGLLGIAAVDFLWRFLK